MADIVEKITFDDSELLKSLNNIDKEMDQLNAKIRETEMSYEEAFAVAAKSMEEAEAATVDAKKATTQLAAETSKAAKASGEWKATIKEQIRDLNVFGQSVGGVIDGLQRKATALKSVAGAVGGASNALKIFKVALISTGIGAIVVALGSLVALLTRTQKGIDTVNVVLKAFGATIDVVIGRAAKFGGALVKFFTGDLKGAAADAKAAFSGVGQEIANNVRQVAALTRASQDLRDATRNLRLEQAQTKAQIEELKKRSDDVTLSINDRKKAAEQAARIEAELANKSVANAEENLRIIREENKLRAERGTLTDEQKDAEVEAEIAIAQVREESARVGTELQNKLGTLTAEQTNRINAQREAAKKLREELQEQIDLIQGAFQKVQLQQLSPEERLKAEAEIARQQIENEFAKLDKLAEAAGKEVDLTKEKNAILAQLDAEYYRQLQALRNEDLVELEKVKDRKVEVTRDLLKEAGQAIAQIQPDLAAATGEAVQKSNLTLGESLDKFKGKLLSGLGLSEEEAEAIAQGIVMVFDMWTAGTQRALDQNTQLIDSIQSRRDAIEEDLDEQLALQEKGLANNVSAKQAELAALKAEEEKALKERDRLLKTQAKQQLIADSVAQISSLTTMAANVIGQSGKLGILGIPLAISAIAGFIGIFSAFKAQAKSATADSARFASGGSIDDPSVTGFVNKSGRTDRHGGRGHRVEDSNLILGGREFVVSEGPAHQHAAFLEALNSGRFNEVDLMKELSRNDMAIAVDATTQRFARRAGVIQQIREHQDRQFQVAAMDAVMGRHIGRVVSGLASLNEQIYVIPKTGGTVVHIDAKGNKRIVDHS